MRVGRSRTPGPSPTQSLTDLRELEPGQSSKASSIHSEPQLMQREAHRRDVKTNQVQDTTPLGCLPWAGDGTGNDMLGERSLESTSKPTVSHGDT